jgi:hypothetical protein
MSDPTEDTDAPVTVLQISQVSLTRLRVELVAATEMAFELTLAGNLDYGQAIADVCAVAPAMMTYDAALMEAYDGPGVVRRLLGPRRQIEAFVRRYQTQLTNISVAFPPFEELTQGGVE